MTTQSTQDLPQEDPWAPTIEGQDGSGVRARAAEVLQSLPVDLDAAGDTMAGAVRTVGESVASANDDSLLIGASIASGLAIGLLVGGGPRILAACAVVTAVSLGASLASRHPRHRHAHLSGSVA